MRRDHCSKFLLTLAKVSLVGNSAIVKTDHGPRAVTFNLLLSDKLSACARFFLLFFFSSNTPKVTNFFSFLFYLYLEIVKTINRILYK